METVTIYLQYLYAPLAVALYALHIKVVKIDTKVSDYISLKKDIYAFLNDLKKDVHYLIKIREEGR